MCGVEPPISPPHVPPPLCFVSSTSSSFLYIVVVNGGDGGAVSSCDEGDGYVLDDGVGVGLHVHCRRGVDVVDVRGVVVAAS